MVNIGHCQRKRLDNLRASDLASHANFAFKSKHPFQIALTDKQLLSLSTHFN